MIYLHRFITIILLSTCILISYLFYNLHRKVNIIEKRAVASTFIQDVRLPAKFDFCGEAVPLDDPEVSERIDYELVSNVHLHSRTILVLKRAHRWFPQIEPILKEYHIPDDFKYLAVIESNLTNAVSHVGASGFWQFMAKTAPEFDLRVNEQVDERYHVLKATRAACQYLQKAYEKTGSWTNAAASYNVGIHGLTKRLTAQKVTSYYDAILPDETMRYVPRILALKAIMQNPKQYGFEISPANQYEKLPIRIVKIDSSILDLQGFAIQQGMNHKLLKYYNPWLKSHQLIVKDSTDGYEIALPQNATAGKLHRSIYQEVRTEKDTILTKTAFISGDPK